MKKPSIPFSAVIVIITLISARLVFGQGSLTPPGEPEPTMKTLQQVEPRTPISALPFAITNPGSYYLTANLTGNVGGITIQASSVTLDLSGFELVGGNGIGIFVSGVRTHITVRNGTVRGWSGSGVDVGGALGCRLEGLNASLNGVFGLAAGQHAVVVNCIAQTNGMAGISAAANAILNHCVAALNTEAGIVANASLISECTARMNGVGIDAGTGSLVRDCVVSFNSGDAIQIDDKCVVTGNTCNDNGGAGILAPSVGFTVSNRIEGNNVIRNGRGIDLGSNGNLVIRNSAAGNPVGSGVSNYVFSAGQIFGPTNNLLGTGGVITNVNPWANLSY